MKMFRFLCNASIYSFTITGLVLKPSQWFWKLALSVDNASVGSQQYLVCGHWQGKGDFEHIWSVQCLLSALGLLAKTVNMKTKEREPGDLSTIAHFLSGSLKSPKSRVIPSPIFRGISAQTECFHLAHLKWLIPFCSSLPPLPLPVQVNNFKC